MNAFQAPTEVVIEETLRWVNDIRAETGREPLQEMPKGKPDNVCYCPVAKAVRFNETDAEAKNSITRTFVYAGMESVVIGRDDIGTKEYSYPELVYAFVRRFDRGEISELLEETEPNR